MELWDIYDKDKKPTGRTMKRNDWCLKEGEYHLSVLGVIQRPDGKYLITKRAADKAWAPGWWEVSGGAAIAGETSEDAVKREILEETGLDVTNAEGGFLFSYHRENPGEGDNYFVDITMRNTSNQIAFFNQLQFLNAKMSPIRPSFYTDNFFSLTPGEKKTVTIETAKKKLGEGVILVLKGWNIDSQKYKLK